MNVAVEQAVAATRLPAVSDLPEQAASVATTSTKEQEAAEEEHLPLITRLLQRLVRSRIQSNTNVDMLMLIGDFSASESHSWLLFSTEEREIGLLSEAEISAIIRQYEEEFGMTSEQFLALWEAGEAPDTFETNDWAILLAST